MTAPAVTERRRPRKPAAPVALPSAVAPSPLWTEEEVAAYLKVSPRALRRMRIPRVALPGSRTRPIYRFDPAEVLAFIEGRKLGRPATARADLRLDP